MKLSFSLPLLSVLAASVSAFGQLDPQIQVGPYGVNCKTFNCSGDPTTIGATGFTLMSNGAQTADVPWYILIAVPGTGKTDMAGGSDPAAPIVSGPSGFTVSHGVDAGDFLPSTSGDIYAFASAFDNGDQGDGSMNSSNLFGSAEQTAFGGTPSFFDIFVYTVNPGTLTGNSSFSFLANLQGLAGTFVGAVGCAAAGGNPCGQQFSTPFTTAGLVQTTSTSVSGPFSTGSVPEPSSIMLFGTVLVGLGAVLRKKRVRS